KGASHGSKADEDIWDEFHENGEDLVLEAQQILANKRGEPFRLRKDKTIDDHGRIGLDRDASVKTRVGQTFFRSAVLASYNWACCVTGLREIKLLNASHIIPWSIDRKNRVNPCNGLCLNALHDRAFDRGLMTISADYRIVFASEIRDCNDEPINALLLNYEGRELTMPERFLPDQEHLRYHREKIFAG
nr:HNH endonuclease [PVC group bacterium]